MVDKVQVELTFEEKQALRAIANFQEKITASSKRIEKELTSVSDAFGKVTSSIAVGNLAAKAIAQTYDFLRDSIGESFREYIRFEEAQVAVAKTTNLTESEMANLVKRIETLSTKIPVARDELLQMTATAGQLGVRGVDNLSKFTETMAKLAVTTDVSGEEAAKSILRILNVTSEGVETVGDFANALVSLGNQAKASESEILSIASEIARSTTQYDVSSVKVLALATTYKEMGQQARVAASVTGDVFLNIQKAIEKGGESFVRLQKLTQMTGDQLRKTFKEDSFAVFKAFVEGINRASQGSVTISSVLEKFGLRGSEVNKVLPALIKNVENLGKSSDVANDAVADGSSLSQEAATAFDTFGKSLDKAGNNISRIGGNIASIFVPSLKAVVDLFNQLAIVSNRAGSEQLKTSNSIKIGEKNLADLEKQLERVTSGQISASPKIVSSIQAMIDKQKEELAILKDKGVEQDKQVSKKPKETEVQATDDGRTTKEKNILSEITMLREQAELEENARDLRVKEATLSATEFELEQIRIAEEEKLIIAQDAALRKAEFIDSKAQEELEIKRIYAETALKQEQLATKNSIAAAKKSEEERKKGLMSLFDFEKNTNAGRAANFKSTLGSIATLSSSSNKELFFIGKAAAVAQGTIDGIAAVQKALASAPPPYNFALAALVGVATAANLAKIASSQPPSFQNGGIVPGPPNPMGRDNTTANVASGELILNRAQQDNVAGEMPSNALLASIDAKLSMLIAKSTTIQIDGREIARTVQDEIRGGFQLA